MTVALFRRGKSQQDAADLDETRRDAELNANGDSDGVLGSVGGDGTTAAGEVRGPLDRSALVDDSDYLNLGSIWLRGQQGLELRLEINEQEDQITGVTAVIGESAVQLQAFAAPRTEGVWFDIRDEIATSITGSGGTAEVVSGPFGEELLTRMPQAGPDGRTVFMPARFIGVDGPRWFLRAVISGRAAIEAEAATEMHELVRTAVVDRGDDAMPPRELLPLRLPENNTATEPEPASEHAEHQADPAAAQNENDDPGHSGTESAAGTDDGSAASLDDFKPFERGPEITEVR